jgi:hypothetical protein
MKVGALLVVGVLVMVAGSILPFSPIVLFAEVSATSSDVFSTTTAAEPSVEGSVVKNIHNAAEVEKQVRSFFEDAPVMAEIARCESKFRQYTDIGNVLRGGAGGAMIGVFQFHEGYHAKNAQVLGFDIYSLDGNIGYADYVYKMSGTDPWISSFGCWNDRVETGQAAGADSSELDANLSFGQTHPQVLVLQRFLNKAGFAVADDGPGSPGNETTMFGNLTRAAVRKFQCAKQIACEGDEYSTGYGYVGPKTRAALIAHTVDGTKSVKSQTTVKKSSNSRETGSLSSSDEERKKLEAQIAELVKLVAKLQAQISLLAKKEM